MAKKTRSKKSTATKTSKTANPFKQKLASAKNELKELKTRSKSALEAAYQTGYAKGVADCGKLGAQKGEAMHKAIDKAVQNTRKAVDKEFATKLSKKMKATTKGAKKAPAKKKKAAAKKTAAKSKKVATKKASTGKRRGRPAKKKSAAKKK